METVSATNPIKIFPDGNLWCALIGEDLQEGTAVFADSPIQALTTLLKGGQRTLTVTPTDLIADMGKVLEAIQGQDGEQVTEE